MTRRLTLTTSQKDDYDQTLEKTSAEDLTKTEKTHKNPKPKAWEGGPAILRLN